MKVQQYLEQYDQFGGDAFLLFKGKKKNSSTLSIIITIILYLFFIYLFFECLFDHLNHKNYVINQMIDENKDQIQTLYIDIDSMISVKIQNPQLMKEFNDYFQILLVTKNTNKKTGEITFKEQFLIENCNINHFNSQMQQYFEDNLIQISICIKKDQKIELQKNRVNETSLFIEIQTCNPSQNANCKDLSNPSVLQNYTQTFGYSQNIEIFHAQTVFQITNFYQPIKKVLNKVKSSFKVKNDQYKNLVLQTQKYTFYQDTRFSIIFSEPELQFGQFYNNAEMHFDSLYQDPLVSRYIFTIEIKPSTKTTHYSIVYDKFNAYLLSMIGSSKIILIIIHTLMAYGNKNYFLLELLKAKNGIEFEYTWIDILTLYSKKVKHYESQINLLKTQFDLLHILNLNNTTISFQKNIISQKSMKMLQILNQNPQDINQLGALIYRQILIIKSDEKNVKKRQKNKNQAIETIIQEYELNTLNNKDQEDQTLNYMYEFIEGLNQIDDNIFKNQIDFIIEYQFDKFLRDNMNIRIDYDFKTKYKKYIDRKNTLIQK